MLPIIGVITFLLLLVYYSLVSSSRNKEYFKSRKVLDLNNTLFRVLVDGVLKGKGVSGMIRLNYEKMVKAEAGIAGNIFMNQVDYFVADLELLKHICIKDFQHFGQRRIIAEIQDPLINRMVFFQTCPQQWRALRSKLSPTLSLTRVKQLFPAFDETSQKLVNYIVTHRSPSGEINLAQAASKFALASAASALFGLDCGALDQGEPSVFERIGNRLKIEAEFNPGQFLILLGFPKLASFFGLSMFGKELRTFFESQVKSVLQNPDNKNNVVQWITESRVTNDEQLELDQTLSDDDIVSNAVLFLFTGFQPISSILLFASYALSQRPRVQEKLGAEVDAIWEKNGGSFTYESLAEMPYLDQVINGTSRWVIWIRVTFLIMLYFRNTETLPTSLVCRSALRQRLPGTGDGTGYSERRRGYHPHYRDSP